MGFSVYFVSILAQYIPVEELDTENAALVQRGFSLYSDIRWHQISCRQSSGARATKVLLHRCTSPREAYDPLLAWYGPRPLVAKSDLSLSLNSFQIAPKSNLIEEMGIIEDIAAEME